MSEIVIQPAKHPVTLWRPNLVSPVFIQQAFHQWAFMSVNTLLIYRLCQWEFIYVHSNGWLMSLTLNCRLVLIWKTVRAWNLSCFHLYSYKIFNFPIFFPVNWLFAKHTWDYRKSQSITATDKNPVHGLKIMKIVRRKDRGSFFYVSLFYWLLWVKNTDKKATKTMGLVR